MLLSLFTIEGLLCSQDAIDKRQQKDSHCVQGLTEVLAERCWLCCSEAYFPCTNNQKEPEQQCGSSFSEAQLRFSAPCGRKEQSRG